MSPASISGTPRGYCVWLTGLSGAGKTTIAQRLSAMLQAYGQQVVILDGDVVRTQFSQDLGFSRHDRETNMQRVARAASDMIAQGTSVICALISPYRSARAACRVIIGQDVFVEVFVDTPLATCEQRDPKGLYAKARRGEIRQFTGIDDPYEPPLHPDVRLATAEASPPEYARQILAYLVTRGMIDGTTVEPQTLSMEIER